MLVIQKKNKSRKSQDTNEDSTGYAINLRTLSHSEPSTTYAPIRKSLQKTPYEGLPNTPNLLILSDPKEKSFQEPKPSNWSIDWSGIKVLETIGKGGNSLIKSILCYSIL